MDAIELLRETERRIEEASERSKKPRRTGITMLLVFDVANYGPEFVAPFAHLVDRVKLLDTMWHVDPGIVVRSIERYRELDIDVAMGGTQFEIALAQDRLDEYVDSLRQLGINEVEVEHHADSESGERIREELAYFKERGFFVVGEVGKKWWWKDPTRASRDRIDTERTVSDINTYLDAGADLVYWEGAVVGALIGRQQENEKGQQQLLEVIDGVSDPERLVFEVYDRRSQPLYPMIAWLVQHFGPNVNLANIDPWLVKRVEWIRQGIIFEMDHPYMRWRRDPSQAEHWWDLEEMPDYAVDVQRPYAMGPEF